MQFSFILVKDRSPRGSLSCAGCREQLGLGYLREISSQHVYCKYNCYARDRKAAGAAFGCPELDSWSTARPSHLSGLYLASATPTSARAEPLHVR
jgi:hypothetical protein